MLEIKRLQWADYLVFASVILISLIIGVAQGFIGGKQKTKEEYLLGNRRLHSMPVMLSILASFLSAILIIGVPADVYTTGVVYVFFAPAMGLGTFVAALYFVPLLYPLKITSAYEYLELRFKSRTARIVGTLLAMVNMILYSGVVAYAPATALQAVTGFPTWASIILVCVVATLYTTVGGMKAVVWTDAFQIIIMAMGILSITVKGFISQENIWENCEEGGRMNFDTMFDPDPKIRHSFWTVLIGGALTWLAQVGVHQASVQRISSLPSLTKARVVMFISAIFGFPILCSLSGLNGLIVYSHYHEQKCDPLKGNIISNSNQFIPYYVLDVFGDLPGFTGLLVAALFCGALSTVSSNINGLSAMIWEDFLKNSLEHKMTQGRISLVLKLTAFIFGAIMTGVAFLANSLGGTTTSIALSVFGATGGPLLGMFFLGSLCPWANWIGASVSGVLGFCLCMWMAVGARTIPPYPPLPPAPTSNCVAFMNSTLWNATSTTSLADMTTAMMTSTPEPTTNPLQPFYSLSYMWYSAVGVMTVMIVGNILSLITGRMKSEDVDGRLIVPICDWFFCYCPHSVRDYFRCGVNHDDDKDELQDKTAMNGTEMNGTSNPVYTVEKEGTKI